MASNARGSHVSPGIYSREIDVNYSVQSLGITQLGLVGETLKGPAFEPIDIPDWATFKNYFGGTSAEKFAGTGYPKYELPYIAKSYLTESKKLRVCRVLGLSGYNAGKAWLLSVDCEDKSKNSYKQLVAVLRSRGHYDKYARVNNGVDMCSQPIYNYDQIVWEVDEIRIAPYVSVLQQVFCDDAEALTKKKSFDVSMTNFGQFTLVGYKYDYDENGEVVSTREVGRYGVSLNPGTKNYILDVLGGTQSDGEAPFFVEELYDVALYQAIEAGLAKNITTGDEMSGETSGETEEYKLECVDNKPIIPVAEPVISEMIIPEDQLTRKQMGQRYICNKDNEENFTCHEYDEDGEIIISGASTPEAGYVYTVKMVNVDGKKKYFYVKVPVYTMSGDVPTLIEYENIREEGDYIFVEKYNTYFAWDAEKSDIAQVVIDMNNYKEQFRCATTPWLISEIKGDGKTLDVKKLFRFHTISDGNDANSQVKISIQNILPDDGLFDVLVRDFSDSDGNMTILERYSKCNLIPGSPNYIAYKIGSTDGSYELKSKYVTVEMFDENEVIAGCIPCGFLGYPIRCYENVEAPVLKYNCNYDEEIKDRKQYFGMSDLVGVDVDVLTYKGVEAYKGHIVGYTNGFHLDSYMDVETNPDLNITVDGVSGYTFSTVSPLNVTNQYSNPCMIGTEEDMSDTIFANVNLRKFTLYPYGGFDGWDIYRSERTNSDDFKANKYKGSIINGVGTNFSRIKDGEGLRLTGNCITSDYYAYLAGIRQFENKEEIEMNIFATPGIDYVNQKLLSIEALDMIEEERADSVYIMTTPDKPAGASDSIVEMYTPEEVVENLQDSDIDSSYAATYYPWVKFEDIENDIYINLPVTKDIVRNMAMTDNNAFPWYAPAGINRGPVSCVKAHYTTKLADEDVLYEAGINPVKTFAQDGVKIWGNKTMYSQDTPLNRLNTRRLMLRVKRLIENACRQLIFDPNDSTVKSQFLSLVNPILSNTQKNRGITKYDVRVDDSAEARDRHELPAVIRIMPIGALEYIDLTFYITPEGATWE